ncbi:MAG: hypothetical protein JWM32_1830 [Verrucomicrobia bacterium]|nr:hypothetical protein [Verrucomicrobiota bacterium]
MNLYFRLALLPLAFAASGAFAAESSSQITGLAPVSVSAANYRNTPRDELVRLVEGERTEINPNAPSLKPLAKSQHFIFLPGAIFESDLTYDQVTELLTGALAKKGYINGADAQGVIREPGKITLVLRINYGARLWRLPTVRTDDLAWREGIVQDSKGVGLHNLGAEHTWDHRSGGNDDALGAIASNNANGQAFSFGSSGKTGSGGGAAAEGTVNVEAGPSSAGVDGEYGLTRDFNLIVVDAFDYQELKTKGKFAKRVWSTFVSAPKKKGQKFSQIAETLVRNATPFFGETSQGLQIYTDRRAEVIIGEAIVIKDGEKK